LIQFSLLQLLGLAFKVCSGVLMVFYMLRLAQCKCQCPHRDTIRHQYIDIAH